MPKRAELIPQDDIEDIIFDPTDEHQTEYDRKIADFANAMSDLGDNGEIIVKRQTGTGKDPMEHVGYFEPDEYTHGQLIEHLRREYGGGLYRIYLRMNGRNKANTLIRIAEPIKRTNDDTSGNALAGRGELSAILRVISDQNAQVINAVKSLNDGGSRMDMLNEMLVMKQLFDSPQQSSGISQLKESFELLSDLGAFNKSDSGDDDAGFSALIEKAAPLFLQQQQPQQPQPRANPSP